MAQSVRVSDDLYSMAHMVSQGLGRPLAQQLEYWARLGAALDAAGLSSSAAMELLGNGSSADEFLQAALGMDASAGIGLPMLNARKLKYTDEVSAGHRTPQSLWAFPAGAMKNHLTVKRRAESEFEQVGSGW